MVQPVRMRGFDPLNPQDHRDQFSRTSSLVERTGNDTLYCLACAHTCRLKPGQRGACKIRYNRDGEL